MDNQVAPKQILLEQVFQQLARFGLTVGDPDRPDETLSLRWDGGEVEYRIEERRGLRPAMLGPIILHMEQLGPDTLLITDYVSPPVAEQLRERGIQFVDAAGNAYLKQGPLLIWVKGERPAQQAAAPTVGRAFRPTGLRVLFALLAVPHLARRPYRDIAEHAGVAHGSVGVVMTELSKLGYLAKIGEQRRLLQPERMMREWVEAYARTLRPKLVLRTFRSPTVDWWRDVDLAGLRLALGGEAAAARMTGLIEPELLTLYGSRAAVTGFMVKHPMEPAFDANVEVLQRFWHFEQDPSELTPPLLIYADLLATGDARCIEAAQALEAQVVDRLTG